MLIVEDGTGVDGANSYATAQDAIDYFAERGSVVVIQDSDMINGTDYLDTTFGMSYKGSLLDVEQSLLYPRTSFVDNLGRPVEAGTIPKALTDALFQSAKLSSEGVQLIDNPDATSQLQSYSKSIEGAVSKSETFFAPVNRNQRLYVSAYIIPILDRANTGRTVRA